MNKSYPRSAYPLRWLTLWIALTLLYAPAVSHASRSPDVVVSIKPIHSLLAGVMKGVGKPKLLIEGAVSAHVYTMTPSDARKLSAADVVFWVGKPLEPYLEKAIQSLAANAHIVTLLEQREILVASERTDGDWNHDNHEPSDHHATDPHIWLDPTNAKQIVRLAVTKLSQLDPNHANVYAANGAELISRLDHIDTEIAAKLAPINAVPYMVFHDAYQGFEKHFGTHAVGSITINPERKPGARRLGEIRARVRDRKVRCVFAEPQFEPTLIGTITQGTSAKIGTLDPMGADITAGPEAYFILINAMADALLTCLSD